MQWGVFISAPHPILMNWNYINDCSLPRRSKRSATMAVIIEKDGGGGSGGSVILGFILGAVMLAAAVVGFLMWDNYKSGGAPKAVVITGQPK
jgi:hypothetical protein